MILSKKIPAISVLFLGLAAASAPVMADWSLDGAASSLYYVTSKAAAISEVNHFTRLSGRVTDAGQATLDIDLSSVATNIEIRDERMREIVFQVDQFPSANVTLQVDGAALSALKPGEVREQQVEARLSLHGVEQTLPARVAITGLAGGALQVHNLEPLLVAAGSFGLAAGVEQLREIAGLPSINPNIVVNFTLVYRR